MLDGLAGERVVVVGAGPVGLATALGLARRGVAVEVLERGQGPGTASRASTLHPPALELLDRLGVVDEVQRLGLRSDTYQLRDRAEGLVAEFDLGLLADDTAYPYRVQLEQDKLCRILTAALAEHGVGLRTGHEVDGVRQDATAIAARTTTGELAGTWLVGADGAHSAVREAVGVEAEGITWPERFLVVSTPDDLREALPDLALVNYVSDPDEWVVLLRTPDHWRLLFPVDADADLAAATEAAALQARVQRVAPRAEPWRLVGASAYEVHQRVADRLRVGRVLLAGDAAHLNNPLGGLGMNAGLLDAASLVDSLGDVCLGAASADVLDVWARRRREVALDVVDRQTRANKARLEERDPAARTAHLEAMRDLAKDPVACREHLRRTTLLDVARDDGARGDAARPASIRGRT